MRLLLLTAILSSALPAQVSSWISTQDLRLKMERQPDLAWSQVRPAIPTIELQPDTRFQKMLGMGASLEPTTCWNLSRLDDAARSEVLSRLLSSSEGAGMNLMRICIGTPDFTGDPWYTYNDVPAGETDPDLVRFSIDKDRRYILPVLKQALQMKPDLLFYASPWSPPAWMKTSRSLLGGSLAPEHYAAYARYFVKFVQGYQKEGIPIHAVTVQNEPGVDRLTQALRMHYPSCRYTGAQERDLIRDHLGPAIRGAGLKTEVWSYDHNYNDKASGDDPGIEYPATVLSDPKAAPFVSGVGFHGYEGRPDGMTRFHERFPAVPIYFTEGSVFGMRGMLKLFDILRNWASSYNAWVIMIDEKKGPNNGPFPPSRTIITLDSPSRVVTYHADYYFYSQVMRHVARGAVRIASTDPPGGLKSVAFTNPDGSTVLIAANPADAEQAFQVVAGDSSFGAVLPPQAVGTYLWK